MNILDYIYKKGDGISGMGVTQMQGRAKGSHVGMNNMPSHSPSKFTRGNSQYINTCTDNQREIHNSKIKCQTKLKNTELQNIHSVLNLTEWKDNSVCIFFSLKNATYNISDLIKI